MVAMQKREPRRGHPFTASARFFPNWGDQILRHTMTAPLRRQSSSVRIKVRGSAIAKRSRVWSVVYVWYDHPERTWVEYRNQAGTNSIREQHSTPSHRLSTLSLLLDGA
ncbi:hypothetical protein MRX96_049483 [Rhipicephalus microplus]